MSNILLVEDNKLQRSLIAYLLIENKYKVIQAENSIKALEAIDNEDIDLIISDIEMEGMNGLKLCQKVKSNKKTSSIPFIILTNYESLEEKITGLDIGANDYIPKSYDKTELLARVKTQLRNRDLFVEWQKSSCQEYSDAEQDSEVTTELRKLRLALLPALKNTQLKLGSLVMPVQKHGNDYYEIISVDGIQWFIFGHVNSNNLAGSFIILIIKGVLNGLIHSNPQISPAALYSKLNNMFFENVKQQMGYHEYISLLILKMGDSFEYIQSHEYVAIVTDSTKFLPANASWIGLSKEMPLPTVAKFTMEGNSTLVLCSKGIHQLETHDNKSIEKNEIAKVISEVDHSKDPEQICTDLKQTIEKKYLRKHDVIILVGKTYL